MLSRRAWASSRDGQLSRETAITTNSRRCITGDSPSETSSLTGRLAVDTIFTVASVRRPNFEGCV